MRKKTLTLIPAALLAVGLLAGCGQNDDNAAPTPSVSSYPNSTVHTVGSSNLQFSLPTSWQGADKNAIANEPDSKARFEQLGVGAEALQQVDFMSLDSNAQPCKTSNVTVQQVGTGMVSADEYKKMMDKRLKTLGAVQVSRLEADEVTTPLGKAVMGRYTARMNNQDMLTRQLLVRKDGKTSTITVVGFDEATAQAIADQIKNSVH